ncbi:TetR/AcrR family transcriptional regulator [Companilactobacillus kimchiensis]|uniref:Transcription regulator n=1 Tax=Companilactobacillus kimchiensis TaxID=993692 RepID=A0A0R2LFL2_9LACO|nr:TetR/AcrR family transcriptional regulator [Companilactobacillus kimchiensis]KRO00696.1 transcription regulator [Companilactobacillus kimchiensis]
MKLTGYEDLRVQRTISSIYMAFEKLICEKEYQKITVKELSEMAQINKKTFYRYYPTLDDLLAEMQAQYAKGFLEEVRKLQYPRDLGKSVRSFFTYSAKQGEAYDRITASSVGNYVGIRQQMIDSVMNSTWGESKEFNLLKNWEKRILLNFVEQTGLNVYKQWINQGKKESLEDVIESATALMQGGVDDFLKLNN